MDKRLGIFYLTRQNLRRRLFRSIVTAVAIGALTAVSFPVAILGEGVTRSITQGEERLGADMMVVPPGNTSELASTLIAGEPSTFLMDGSALESVKAISGVEKASPQLYFATLASG